MTDIYTPAWSEPTVEEVVVVPDAAAARIAELEAALESMKDAFSNANQQTLDQKYKHYADIELIGAELLQQAEDRGWCSEFDDIVERLNRKLNVMLPTRSKDYTVTRTYTVTITSSLTAMNEEEAIDSAYGPEWSRMFGGTDWNYVDSDCTDIEAEVD